MLKANMKYIVLQLNITHYMHMHTHTHTHTHAHAHTHTHTHTHRIVQHLDEAPIVDAENGIIAENGIHDDSSLEKQKFEDNL